jgi:hypothetical protein
MLLVSHVGGSVWTVLDFNSGKGLTRLHQRNVGGYVFVTPPRFGNQLAFSAQAGDGQLNY